MSTDSPYDRESVDKFADWLEQCFDNKELQEVAKLLRLMLLPSEIAHTQSGHENAQDGHSDKSETPRTDAYEKEVPVVGTLDQAHRAWGELCRMLERELNAARSAIGTTSTRSDK